MFMVNDVVKCIKDVHFCDNTDHKRGQVYTVTKDTLSYFNNSNNSYHYILWHRG